ncbi:MAG: medium chain dehydrogenase/reductase family protein [Candidatus Acidiferrales bacterium]
MTSERNGRVVVTALGGPEVLKYVEEDMPAPGAGEVRVKVLAAGVAYADILIRRGLYPDQPSLPCSPGYDVVGDIDAVGEGVTEFRAGQRVAALTMIGGYSRFTIVPAAHLVLVPDGLDPAEAVSLVLNYVTAYQMLHRVAHLGDGQKMLVHGAAGGVGTAALQLGKICGLTMFGTASKAKHALVTALGATPIDYRTENFATRIRQLAPEGLDCVLDPIGGTQWWASYGCLRRGGILVCYGAQTMMTKGKMAAGLGFALVGLMKILPDGKHVSWFNAKTFRNEHPEWFREDLSRLFELLKARAIEPVIAARFPLREAARANDMLEKAQASGKIVLLPQE